MIKVFVIFMKFIVFKSYYVEIYRVIDYIIYETIPVADFYHFEQSNAKVMDKCNDEDEMMK